MKNINIFKLIMLFSIIAVIILFNSSAILYALTIELNNIESLKDVKNTVINNIDKIYNESLNSYKLSNKQDIRLKKMSIASEFEDKFNIYTLKIKNYNKNIRLLYKIADNIKELKRYKDDIKYAKNNFIQQMKLLQTLNKDVYIPFVFGSYIEMPLIDSSKKDQEIVKQLLMLLIEHYAIEKIASTSIVKNGIMNELIRSVKLGKLEHDGIRDYDGHDIIERTQDKKIRYLKISFYRFKPFATQSDDSISIHDNKNYFTKFWNLSLTNSNEMYNYIKSTFNYNFEKELNDINNYIISLGDTRTMVKKGVQRVKNILNDINIVEKEYNERIQYFKDNISRLRKNNSNLLKQIGLNKNVSLTTLEKYTKKIIKEKELLEKSFEYKFVQMEELSGRDFTKLIKYTIEEIFDNISNMVKQQTISIESIVNSGVMQNYSRNSFDFYPVYTNIYVIPYVEGPITGVFMVLSVKYNKSHSEQNQSDDSTMPEPDFENMYIESYEGENIYMVLVEYQGIRFYITKSEITKGQFMKFLDNTNKPITSFLINSQCEELIKDYPDNYPIFCISKKGINKFISWLTIKSGKEYQYPKPVHLEYAAHKGIFTDNGFHVVRKIKE